MPRLVVDSVSSASRLRRSLSPGAAGDHGDVDGDELVVDDAAEAQALVDTYPNVRWADADADHDTTPDQTPRLDVDGDEATYECGVNGCSRDVESPADTCWQHSEE